VVDKPLIQYAVEEAYEAGIRHMIFVTGRSKRAIEDHFDNAYELETELEKAKKFELLAILKSVQPEGMNFSYVRQNRMLGLGHAVLCAEHLVGNEAFAVLLADDLMVGPAGGPSVMKQMVEQFNELQSSILAVQQVPPEHTRRYGIVAGDVVAKGLTKVSQIVEKPAPEVAPSLIGVAGRYILTPAIFAHIRQQTSGVGGEIQLTDGIASLIIQESVYAFEYQGKRYDCGSKQGFLQATVELAMQHHEVGAEFKQYLAQLKLD
jgi:UTP--glucose-1-phosphate uridylyltransferase